MMVVKEFVKKRTAILNQNVKLLENLLLKRDNKELKDLTILERVLNQVLRDQEEKRSLKLENREGSKWRKVKTGHKLSERKQSGKVEQF